MVPKHILSSNLYKILCYNHGNTSFLDDHKIIYFDKIENDEQFRKYAKNLIY